MKSGRARGGLRKQARLRPRLRTEASESDDHVRNAKPPTLLRSTKYS